jgi:hypothetical protein
MELGPFSRESTLLPQEVALLPSELRPFPKDSTLLLKEIALFFGELRPFLKKIQCLFEIFFFLLMQIVFQGISFVL